MQPLLRTRVLVHEPNKALWGHWGTVLRNANFEVAAITGSLDNPRANLYLPSPDLIILQLSDDNFPLETIEAAAYIHEKHNIPVLLVSVNASRSTVRLAAQAGLYSFVSAPVQATSLIPAMHLAIAAWETQTAERKKLEVLKRKDASRGAVQDAKSILMREFGLTEEDAYRKLRTASMNARRPMGDVAQAVVRGERMKVSAEELAASRVLTAPRTEALQAIA